MNQLQRIFIFVLVATLGVVSFANAQTATFNVSLGYGSTNKTEVLKLQQFLYNLGYLKVTPTGAYFGMTQKAVADYQTAEGISPASGYFGPLTRASANAKASGTSAVSAPVTAPASVSDVTVESTVNPGSVVLSGSKTIRWRTNSTYPADAGININLLRKTGDNPTRYDLIRVVATNTVNDGAEVWVPQAGENSADVYIEVACSSTYQFRSGCQMNSTIVKAN